MTLSPICKARVANTAANDPCECDWPMCGCDPYADKVIAALQECGALLDPSRKAARSFAQDVLDLFLEYRDQHDYDEGKARDTAISEAIDGAPFEHFITTTGDGSEASA